MVDWEIVIAILGIIVALVSLLTRANTAEIIAILLAFGIVGITLGMMASTTLPSGTLCPGAFGGDIHWGYSALYSNDQMLLDLNECTRIVNSANQTTFWVFIFGGGMVLGAIMIGRDERRRKSRHDK